MRRSIWTTAVAAVLATLSAAAVSAQTPPASPPGLERAVAVQSRHTDDLMTRRGVVGTAVGFAADGAPVIKVFAESRDVAGLPRRLDGIPVVVQVTGEIYALHHRPGHGGGPGDDNAEPPPPECAPTEHCARPVPIGVSTGHTAITAGTIAARLTDGSDVFALSNNHVYANENVAAIGDSVLQPGPYDGGADPDDWIGALLDFEPIVFSPTASNLMDAAVALSSPDHIGRATPSDGYGTPQSTTVEPSISLRVKKYGRTTGLTKGRITGLNATVDVGYESGVARFVGQMIIEPGGFSAPGDSGSLVVVDGKGASRKDDRKPVGLLFAGSAFITVASPIDPVLERFGLGIDGE